MGLFDERLRIDGKRADARIEDNIAAAKLVRSMEGAASVVLVVNDNGGKLLRSDVLTRPGEAKRDKLTQAAWSRFGRARLTLDGVRYRLAGVTGQYDEEAQQLTLTFEDEVWALLRLHKGPMKATRGGVTRAQFIARMVREVNPRPVYVIPELSEDQPVKGRLPEQRRKRREKGFAPDAELTIQGDRADRAQKRNLTVSLTVADEEKAGERATIAMLCAGIGESSFRAIMNTAGSGYGGVFQGDVTANYRYFKVGETEAMARHFLLGGKGFQGGGAIKLAADNPEWSAGRIALTVEGSVSNFSSAAVGEGFYDQWREEAEDILDAWGGPGRVKIVSSKYEYRRLGARRGEEDERSTECIRRLADEVRWRAWADMNVFELVTDEWLFQNSPIATVKPDSPGLAGVSFDADVGTPISEVRLKARTARWDGGPGDCTALKDFGGLDGRWLTWLLEHDLLTEDTAISLHRPRPALPEPAPDREKVVLTETDELDRGSPQQRVIQAAKRALRRKDEFIYSMVGGEMASLWTRDVPNRTTIGLRFDCSKFVTLCFKYANAPDPNGADYRGASFTGSLMANGEKTNDPTPGDTLVFFGANPAAAGGNSHVGLYIGDGMMIDNHGPTGGHGLEKRKVSAAGTPHSYRKYEVA